METDFLKNLDFEKLNALLESFNRLTGLSTAIIDTEGNILAKSEWKQICTEFHRAHPETAQYCVISDTELSKKIAQGKKYHSYQCLNGLIDVAMPLVIKGKHIANLFIGQFFHEEPDYDFFIKQAEKYGFDEKIYLEALKKVPVVTKEYGLIAMEHFSSMVQLVSETLYRNIRQNELNDALKESEDHFQSLFNKAPLGYQSLDSDGFIIDVNQQWLDTLGYERQEVIGKWFGCFITAANKDNFREQFQIFKAQGHIHSEFEMNHKNGGVLFLAFEGKIAHDLNGNFKQTHCIFQDITQWKQAEEKIKSSYALLQIAGNTAHFGGWSVDLEKKICTWSDAVADIHEMPRGYAPSLQEGINFYAPEWHEKITQLFNDCAQNGIPYDQDMEIITKNGKRVWVRTIGIAQKDEKGNIIKVEGSFQDITQRKVLREEIMLLAHTLKSINECVSIANSQDRLIFVNDSFIDTYGYSREELIGKDISIVDSPKNPPNFQKDIFAATLKGGWSGEIWNKRKDGSEFPISLSTKIFFDNENKPYAFIGVAKDITERKQAEEKILKLNEELENKVAERTQELQKRVSELEIFYDATINREFRIKELRDEIERLKNKKGE
jgi:PAS domain S-box-containing protein